MLRVHKEYGVKMHKLLLLISFFLMPSVAAFSATDTNSEGGFSFSSVVSEEIQTVEFAGIPLRAHSKCKKVFLRSQNLLECSYKISDENFEEGQIQALSHWTNDNYDKDEFSPVQDIRILNNLILVYFYMEPFEDASSSDSKSLEKIIAAINANLEKSSHTISLSYEGQDFESFDSSSLLEPYERVPAPTEDR